MENPMLLWYIVVGALLIAFFVHFVRYAVTTRHHRHAADHLRHSLIEIGRERDMFYVPGDQSLDDDDV